MITISSDIVTKMTGKVKAPFPSSVLRYLVECRAICDCVKEENGKKTWRTDSLKWKKYIYATIYQESFFKLVGEVFQLDLSDILFSMFLCSPIIPIPETIIHNDGAIYKISFLQPNWNSLDYNLDKFSNDSFVVAYEAICLEILQKMQTIGLIKSLEIT